MIQYFPILKETQLFSGLSENEIREILHCLNATLRSYPKGSFVLQQGDILAHIPVLAKGMLYIQQDDYWGNRSIINSIAAGEMFGEAYASFEGGVMEHDVVAVEDSTVLFLDIRKLLSACPSACRFHSLVIQNLFFAISEKNRRLVQKLGHISKRSTREKLISYLSNEAVRQQSSTFSIPFNRQQLADFLSVDRSAMSNELSKMRKEGLVTFQKNRFTLHQQPPL